jgi:hypothetical protein
VKLSNQCCIIHFMASPNNSFNPSRDWMIFIIELSYHLEGWLRGRVNSSVMSLLSINTKLIAAAPLLNDVRHV